MDRENLAYGIGLTLASVGVSGLIATGMGNSVLSRTIYPQGASVLFSGVSTATLAEMMLVPNPLVINGPAQLFFRSTGSSGAVNILTSLSQGFSGSAIPTP
jgi:hypothetical protein